MANLLPVTSEGKIIYSIKLTDTFSSLCEELQKLGYHEDQKLGIISDSNVFPLYGESIITELKKYFPNVFHYVFEAGEASKNTSTVNGVYEYLIQNHFDRHDLLIALGGGVVGDLTGFTAATYLRGIDFIQVPTTLLSQVDSSIGGKTGVDFMQYKNMVGAFYQPKLVYMNLNVLKTLPKEQLVSGFGEILKHGLIRKNQYFSWMNTHFNEILSLDYSTVETMIYESCMIKRDVVERDPKEKGERALLNFGHTLGHAIEKLKDFTWLHGECVAAGCCLAAEISCIKGNISKEEVDDIKGVFEAFDMNGDISELSADDIVKTTKSDKKMVGNKIKFVLLRSVGDAYIDMSVTDDEMKQVLQG